MSEKKTPGQQLLMLLGVSVCCMFLGAALSRIVLMLAYGDEWLSVSWHPLVILGVGGLTHFFSHVVAFFIFLRVTNLSFKELFPFLPVKWMYLLFLPILAVLCIFFASALTEVSSAFFEAGGFYEIIETDLLRQKELLPLLVHNSPIQLMVGIFVLAILPAVGEEFIYRGILQSCLVDATRNVHFSVFISALIFSAMHLQPVNLLAIAVLGIILGYVYAYTRNTWYGIMLHFLINAFQVMQLYFWPELSV